MQTDMIRIARKRFGSPKLRSLVLVILLVVSVYFLFSARILNRIEGIRGDGIETKSMLTVDFYNGPKQNRMSVQTKVHNVIDQTDTTSYYTYLIVLTKQQSTIIDESSQSTTTAISLLNTEETFIKWRSSMKTVCNGDMTVFSSGHFISFTDLILNKYLVSSRNEGGEEMSKVMNQNENEEYYKINQGFFSIVCSDFPSAFTFLRRKSHLNTWLRNTNAIPHSVATRSSLNVNYFTIIIQRYEYVNLYHTMTDYYSAFLVMKFFEKSPRQTNILFFDTHPKGTLDSVWRTLFGSVTRVSALNNVTRFREAVWAIPGYDTPMYSFDNIPRIPLIDEFHNFFLKRHDITKKPTIDCKHLRLVAIWRRDYVAHPRNPSGRIKRKIANEDELLRVANETGLFVSMIGVQLDKLSMKRQLSLVSNADILVGMHGAGLTHTLFLPTHAGLIELLPNYVPPFGHFEGLARWRHLHYIRWENTDLENEINAEMTRVPPVVFHELLLEMRGLLCNL